MNILIIEDDLFLSQKIKEVFEKKILSNRIDIINSFDSFLDKISIIDSYDTILIDIILWDKKERNWIDILKIIRNKNLNIPIVIISSFSDINWLKNAFDNWANDYIIKPFRLKELELRINRWYKSYFCSMCYNNKDLIEYNWLSYDLQKNEFSYNWKIIKLSKKIKYLLSIFIWYREKLLTEEFLINKIWWDIDLENNRNLRINILRLKKWLNPFWIDKWIKNIRWEWYILIK